MKKIDRCVNAIVVLIVLLLVTSLGVIVYNLIELHLVRNTDWKFLKNIILFSVFLFIVFGAGWFFSVIKTKDGFLEKLSRSYLILLFVPLSFVLVFLALLIISVDPYISEQKTDNTQSSTVRVSYTEIIQKNPVAEEFFVFTRAKSINNEYESILKFPATTVSVASRVINYKKYIDVIRWNRINPYIILGICAVESRGNPDVRGKHSEWGLMQIMFERASEYDTSLTVETANRLFDPKYNILIAVRYLNSLYEKYDGDLDAVIASYNTSPGRYEEIQYHTFEKYGYVSPGFWGMVSFFPTITRRYVPKVFAWAYILEYYEKYKEIPESGLLEPKRTKISFENKLDKIICSIPELRISSLRSVSFSHVQDPHKKKDFFSESYHEYAYTKLSKQSETNNWEAFLSVKENVFSKKNNDYIYVVYNDIPKNNDINAQQIIE